jgi:hypothetical protein
MCFAIMLIQKLILKNNSMKKTFTVLFLLSIFTSTTSWCGKIIYPWRATSSIVQTGNNADIWFIAEEGETIHSIQLKAPYHSINVNYTIEEGTWEYDRNSGNTYNRRITVTVPANAPADRYDVIVNTSKGDVVSTGAIKVVKDFKSEYYIIHMSDAHRWQSGYDGYLIHRKVSEVIKIGNLLDVDVFIESGDQMYSVRNNPWREIGLFQGFPDMGILGLHHSSAATFMIPGNHDSHRNAVELDEGGPDFTADFYNTYYGIQYYHFTYGNSRFAMLNNAWFYKEKSEFQNQYTYQIDETADWLSNTPGTFSLVAMHVPNHWFGNLDKKYSFTMGIWGHLHWDGLSNPFDINGKLKGYAAISPRDNGFHFNLYKVDNNTGDVQFPSGPTGVVEVLKSGNRQDSTTWVMKYNLAYEKTNNGSHNNNTATVKNEFNFPFDNARIRFVMPKGNKYIISSGSGYIEQQFDGTNFCVVDVKFNVPAGTTRSIGIAASEGIDVNNSLFISQSGVPLSMALGQTATVSVTMKNTGTTAWTSKGCWLGSENPTDNNYWGLNRVSLDPADSIAPNGSKIFTFVITAPSTAGTYNFQWKMIHDDAGWFGDISTNVAISVSQGGQDINVTSMELIPAKATLNEFITRQFHAQIAPINATNKSVNWASSNPAVATVSPGGLVKAVAPGTSTLTATTVDGNITAASEVTVIPNNNTYQAEYAEFAGPIIETNQAGFRGEGFLDFINLSNDYIKWTVYVPTTDNYTLSFRYALASNNRPLKFTINDEVKNTSLSFPVTGAWTNWNNYTTIQPLNAGTNTIMLTAIGASGGNFDELTIIGEGLSVNNVYYKPYEPAVNIFPNPTTQGSFSIDISGFEKMNYVQVIIRNLNGQTVYHKILKNPTLLETIRLELEKSLYIISVESEQMRIVKKLVVN